MSQQQKEHTTPSSSIASLSSPTFLRLLADPSIKVVAICGTGGGFDFMHSAHFFPLLRAAGKKVVIHSFSFGDPLNIQKGIKVDPKKLAQLIDGYDHGEKSSKTPFDHLLPSIQHTWPNIVIADGKCRPDRRYGPEVAMATFLDETFNRHEEDLTCDNKYCHAYHPSHTGATTQGEVKSDSDNSGDEDSDPNEIDYTAAHHRHWVYASYARDWTPSALRNFYQVMCLVHKVDAFLCIDGGSDSLQKGDEEGLGDPIEDATTVAAVASLPNEIDEPRIIGDDFESDVSSPRKKIPFVPIRILVALGFGCDRFNGCSDEDGFHAIAELSKLTREPGNEIEAAQTNSQKKISGFLGSMAFEQFSEASQMYSKLIDHAQSQFSFRSVIANSIIESSKGAYGSEVVPESLKERVQPGSLHLWPLMSFAFAFDVRLVMKRSLLCERLMKCYTVEQMYAQLEEMRKLCGRKGLLWS